MKDEFVVKYRRYLINENKRGFILQILPSQNGASNIEYANNMQNVTAMLGM